MAASDELKPTIVRIPDGGGLGFLVDKSHIITCAHVVATALRIKDTVAEGPTGRVSLNFPYIDPGTRITAHVVSWYPRGLRDASSSKAQEIDDVAVLNLDETKPNDAHPVAVSIADPSGEFDAFGYPPESKKFKDGAWAHGKTHGNRLPNGRLQIQQMVAEGILVQRGFSGTPVWSNAHQGIIGMVVEVAIGEGASAGEGLSFLIPSDVLIKAWPPLEKFTKKSHTKIIWNIRRQKNKDFTGRTDLLAALNDAFESESSLSLPQVLVGMPAVGKTQVAVEYVYRYRERYSVIWWVRAEESLTLIEDYVSLATKLDLPSARDLRSKSKIDNSRYSEQRKRLLETVVEEVRGYFEESESSLLIFDNAPNLAAVYDYLPCAPCGHILITSRNPSWLNIAAVHNVNVFNRQESIALLSRLTGDTDANEAYGLAAELDDFPLAIVQAGSYCATRHKTISEYRELFHEFQTELFARGEPPADYKQSVAVTFDIALKAVRSDCPGAADLLNIIAFLSPDDIPRSLIMRWMQLPDSISNHFKNKLDFDDAIATLSQFSLIRVNGDSIAVHRLVQMRTRDRLKEEAAIWAGEAIMMVAEAFVFEEKDLAAWPLSIRLLPHGLAASRHAEEYHVAAKSTGNFLNDAGRCLKNNARFLEAKSVFERAVAAKEKFYGIGHPATAGSIGNLALVLRALAEFDDARILLEQVLGIFEGRHIPDDIDVAFTLNNLGLVLRDLNDPAGARTRFENAFAIKKSHYKTADHVDVVDTEVNLAIALRDLDELHQAKQHLEHALPILETSYGQHHPLVATALSTLGCVLTELHDLEGANDLDRAKEMLERALKIDEETYSPVHPVVAQDLDNLVVVLSRLGDVDGAKELQERASDIRDSLRKRRSR
jgi:tetratricopeptide (TPR) repeat protein